MKLKFKALRVCLLLFLFQSCYPDGADYIEELDIVYTDYDTSFDFKALNTFAIPDSVIKITNPDFTNQNGTSKPDFVPNQEGTLLLNTIRNNMTNIGWTEVDKDANPDVILLPSITTTTTIYYYYNWSYWNWWYPGWYAGWDWYYPGGYYPIYRGGYRTGTLLIQMTEGKASVNNNIPVVWSVVINGILEGSASSINSRLKASIDQAFLQSPYLHQ